MNWIILLLCLAGLWIYIGSHRKDDVIVACMRFFTGIALFLMGLGAWLIKLFAN
ncbi:hypothetical protein IB260_00345 [Pseudomonas sp. PDM23]|uniref:hypothetical protein n=1 Tax=unclassified Pseudomonas TaxID=196821 RepID=UPI00178275A3|nr:MULTISPECIES: hypothetical protein [unclassified Pseudomonas]MBD9573744.1 hypothetical protein [Pseudomonas sp. PDM23]MBD9671580.1 hypothetical protein [Pseudomonas sp. PDM21]